MGVGHKSNDLFRQAANPGIYVYVDAMPNGKPTTVCAHTESVGVAINITSGKVLELYNNCDLRV